MKTFEGYSEMADGSDENAPLVSVVILNYNGKSCLEDCLHSVLKTQYPNFEVILVDNASKDDSLKLAQKVFGAEPRLKIVANQANVGFSGGNNIGFDNSKGAYVVFLNNDTVVDPDWLTTLVRAMQNDPSIGLAQSMILNIDGKTIQAAGWLFSNHLVYKHQLCKDRSSSHKFQRVFEVSFVCGASMMIKRQVAQEMGLFEPKLPFFYDDTLLSLKTWLAKKRVVTVSDSKVRHIGGATNEWEIRFTTYNLLKSKLCLLFDIYPKLTDLAEALVVNGFSIFLNSVYCIKEKNTSAVSGNVRALAWGFKNFRFIWQNKLNHWSKTRISPEKLKTNYVRIKLPIYSYLFPSRLAQDCLAFEIEKYESTVIQETV